MEWRLCKVSKAEKYQGTARKLSKNPPWSKIARDFFCIIITQVSEKTHGFNLIVGQDMSEQLKITLAESM